MQFTASGPMLAFEVAARGVAARQRRGLASGASHPKTFFTTKDTKDTKGTKNHWFLRCSFVSFVSFVPSW